MFNGIVQGVMITLKAHFDGKTFVPDEPVVVPENEPLVLHVETQPTARAPDTEVRDSQSAAEWMIENAIDDPSLPADLSDNLDHYLYGKPKQNP